MKGCARRPDRISRVRSAAARRWRILGSVAPRVRTRPCDGRWPGDERKPDAVPPTCHAPTRRARDGLWPGAVQLTRRAPQRLGATITQRPYHSRHEASVPALYGSSYGLSFQA
jgi:hypothetical protein